MIFYFTIENLLFKYLQTPSSVAMDSRFASLIRNSLFSLYFYLVIALCHPLRYLREIESLHILESEIYEWIVSSSH